MQTVTHTRHAAKAHISANKRLLRAPGVFQPFIRCCSTQQRSTSSDRELPELFNASQEAAAQVALGYGADVDIDSLMAAAAAATAAAVAGASHTSDLLPAAERNGMVPGPLGMQGLMPPNFDEPARALPPEEASLARLGLLRLSHQEAAASVVLLKAQGQPDPRALTRRIAGAGRWQQLDDLLVRHGPSMNTIHATALAGALAKRHRVAVLAALRTAQQQRSHQAQGQQPHSRLALRPRGPSAGVEQLMRRFEALVLSQASAMDSQALSQVLWALGRLQLGDQQALVEKLMLHVGLRASEFNGQGVACVLGSCAKLGHRPAAPWLAHFLGASAAALPTASMQALANTTWALAKLRASPSEAWLRALMASAQPHLTHATPQHLAQLAWGLAKLCAAPDDAWLQAFQHAVRRSVGSFSAKDVAFVAWALARLGASPSAGLVAALSRQAQATVEAMRGDTASCVVYGLARLTEHWRSCSASAPDHSNAGASLAGEAVDAAERAAAAVLQHSLPYLAQYTPEQLHALAVWGAAVLGCRAESAGFSAWREWAEACAAALAPSWSAGADVQRRASAQQALAMLGWARSSPDI